MTSHHTDSSPRQSHSFSRFQKFPFLHVHHWRRRRRPTAACFCSCRHVTADEAGESCLIFLTRNTTTREVMPTSTVTRCPNIIPHGHARPETSDLHLFMEQNVTMGSKVKWRGIMCLTFSKHGNYPSDLNEVRAIESTI